MPPFVRAHVAEFDADTLTALIVAVDEAHAQGQPSLPLTICSGGGDLFHLFAMVDAIRSAPLPVETIALGHAQSAAGVLLAAGTRGRRYVAPLATVMVHEVLTTNTGTVRAHEAEADAAEVKRLHREMCTLLDTLTRRRRGWWERRMAKHKADLVMTAQEAVRAKIADHVGLPWPGAGLALDGEAEA